MAYVEIAARQRKQKDAHRATRRCAKPSVTWMATSEDGRGLRKMNGDHAVT
jgi:hypothetical protein